MQEKLLERMGSQPWLYRYPRAGPILLFVLIVIVTVLSVMAIDRAEYARHQSELDRNVTEAAAALQRRAAESIAILSAASAFFEARGEVTASDFSGFASRLYTRDDQHGSLGLGWAPYLDPQVIPAFEALMRQTADPDYQVTPLPSEDQEASVPVMFLEPATRENRRVLGYDLASEDVRHHAIDEAIRRRAPAISGVVRLKQNADNDNSAGFLIFMPVFQTLGSRQVVRGVVYSPFRGEQFLSAASGLYNSRAYDIAIYDETVAPDHLIASQTLPGASDLTMDRKMSIGGRTWVLRISIKQPAVLTPLSWAMLTLGIMLALAVAIIARLVVRQSEEDRAMLEVIAQQSAIRDSLARELNHRVKNTLANVLSILALTKRSATDLDEFATGLGDRIRALSATHDLLAQTGWTDALLGDVVHSELAPYIGKGSSKVDLQGPEIRLAPGEAMSLGLAIHELATNAAKYGALKGEQGVVRVVWRLLAPEMAEVDWLETGGPKVVEPKSRGFGRDLIEKIVAQELKSDVTLKFNETGVECRLHVPVRQRGPFALRAGAA